jgi:hypothetical protein
MQVSMKKLIKMKNRGVQNFLMIFHQKNFKTQIFDQNASTFFTNHFKSKFEQFTSTFNNNFFHTDNNLLSFPFYMLPIHLRSYVTGLQGTSIPSSSLLTILLKENACFAGYHLLKKNQTLNKFCMKTYIFKHFISESYS